MTKTKKSKPNTTKPGQRRGHATMKAEAAQAKGNRKIGSKSAEAPQEACLTLLRGASIEDLQKSTGWQVHSVRGFLSGVVKRKLGMILISEKAEGGSRRYRISRVATLRD